VGLSENASARDIARQAHNIACNMPLLRFPNAHEMALSIRATALVFEDPRSQELLQRIERIAPSDANVLIIGETGTGKELVARHVHNLSAQAGGPFVAVNCGAFSESLVEAELFGHERGAFTGANQSKPGWFVTANGGTLFLDEIGDLPLPMQVKLLRVLQEREVTRLGSRKSVAIDVRLIAATNVHLEEAVQAGRFREDLFYRLNVAKLALLPLRERPGDILPLVRYFAETYARRLGSTVPALPVATERALLGHPWPGNIRQLENVIHHALLVCRGGVLEPHDLHLTALQVNTTANVPRAARADTLEAALLELFEQNRADLHEHIEATLVKTAYAYCHGNQLQTARLLGISRNIVRARLLKLGMIGAGSVGGAGEDAMPEALPSDRSGPALSAHRLTAG
jgi:sigma-54-specific transcriptional regulator